MVNISSFIYISIAHVAYVNREIDTHFYQRPQIHIQDPTYIVTFDLNLWLIFSIVNIITSASFLSQDSSYVSSQ